mgnify:CR=1 FL=1
MSDEKASRLAGAVNWLLTLMCKDFNVPMEKCPLAEVVPNEEIEKKCGVDACGCYDYVRQEIILSTKCADLGSVLHEFKHHLQFLDAGENPDKAFTGYDKPHCRRPHERDAKNFTTVFYRFYIDAWDEIRRREGLGEEKHGKP